MKLINIVYHAHHDLSTARQVIEKHAPTFGYVPYISDRLNVQLIKHYREEAKEETDGVPVLFFRRRNGFWSIPFATHRYIVSARPDFILVEGFIFPLQVIALKLALRKHCKIIVQHHGESPYRGYRKVFQKIADRCIDAYLFTSNGNSRKWIERGVIRKKEKCYEVLGASTCMSGSGKQHCRELLHMEQGALFLWVGRLNENKDPLTVLRAFSAYLLFNSRARLYMIFHTAELLAAVKQALHDDPRLRAAVSLVGQVPHEALAVWYSAADFYISASHRESCGYALLEAMACGCIPIVTRIPSFRKITADGEVGFLYPPGDSDSLFAILKSLPLTELDKHSGKVLQHFDRNLSFRNIAADMYKVCDELSQK